MVRNGFLTGSCGASLRSSQVPCPVNDDDGDQQDALLRSWHCMRYWAGGDNVEPGFELANGSVYTGDLSSAGAPEGSGRLTSGDQGWEYNGDFAAGAPAGVGSLRVAKSTAEGLFENDRLVEGSYTLTGIYIYIYVHIYTCIHIYR